MTNVSNVYFALRLLPPDDAVAVLVGGLVKYDGQDSWTLASASRSSSTSSCSARSVGTGSAAPIARWRRRCAPDPASAKSVDPTRSFARGAESMSLLLRGSPRVSASSDGAAMRTPSPSTFCPRWRLRARRIGSRRSRSIASCASGDGTDSNAKPCAYVSGLTSASHAFCALVSAAPSPASEVSSATTSRQTFAKAFGSSFTVCPPRMRA